MGWFFTFTIYGLLGLSGLERSQWDLADSLCIECQSKINQSWQPTASSGDADPPRPFSDREPEWNITFFTFVWLSASSARPKRLQKRSAPMLVVLDFKLQSLPLRSNPTVRTHPGWLECLCKLGMSAQSRRAGIAFAAGCCTRQYTYSEGQTCFGWQGQVNIRIAVRFFWLALPVRSPVIATHPAMILIYGFNSNVFFPPPTAFLMARNPMLILDAVPVNHSGDDRLHPAHAHRPGLHHGSEVRYSSCIDWYLLKQWRKKKRGYVSGSQAGGWNSKIFYPDSR